MNDNDDLSAFESKTTTHKLPAGWLVLFFGLIVWAAVYIGLYTPAFSGWTQAKAFTESTQK